MTGASRKPALTATALQQIALEHGWSSEFLSFNDPRGTRFLETGAGIIGLRGFGRAKIRFVLAAMKRARSIEKTAATIVIAAHPHLAVPARWMRKVSPASEDHRDGARMEVRKPLASSRRRALLDADLVLAPSHDAA